MYLRLVQWWVLASVVRFVGYAIIMKGWSVPMQFRNSQNRSLFEYKDSIHVNACHFLMSLPLPVLSKTA